MARRKKKSNRSRTNRRQPQQPKVVGVVEETKSIEETVAEEPETIGGVEVVEEKISTNVVELEKVERKRAKPLDKSSKEKVKSMPQTYIEDTFNYEDNHSEEMVITNDVKKKTKSYITRDELVNSQQFKLKVDRIKKRIMFEKSFNELLDFVRLSKMYRTYHIDETTDEIDVLLYELVIYFKRNMVRIQMSFEDYQKVNAYFESLKSLYNRFNHGEGSIKEDLKLELEKLYSADNFIKRKLF